MFGKIRSEWRAAEAHRIAMKTRGEQTTRQHHRPGEFQDARARLQRTLLGVSAWAGGIARHPDRGQWEAVVELTWVLSLRCSEGSGAFRLAAFAGRDGLARSLIEKPSDEPNMDDAVECQEKAGRPPQILLSEGRVTVG